MTADGDNRTEKRADALQWEAPLKAPDESFARRAIDVASPQHRALKFCVSGEPAPVFCVSRGVTISLIPHWSEEKFKREWMVVAGPVGFALEMDV